MAMAEVVPLNTIGTVGGKVSENRNAKQPADRHPDHRDDHDLDHRSRRHSRVGGADRLEHTDLGDFLQNLDLEETADDQDADKQGETALGVERALLGGIARQGLDGFVHGGRLDVVHLGHDPLADFIHLCRIIQLDQEHVGDRVRAVHFGFRFRADAVPGVEGHKNGWLQGILLPAGDAHHAQLIKFILGALGYAQGKRITHIKLAAHGRVAVDDDFLGRIRAELLALNHRRLAGTARLNPQQGHFQRIGDQRVGSG